MRDVGRLKSLCKEVVDNPGFKERPDGTTFCNQAVDMIASKMGCQDFAAKNANQIVARVQSGGGWKPCDGKTAVDWALSGALAIAGAIEAVHGHVTVIYPDEMQDSPSLKKKVPMVAHVGKEPNGIKRVSQAFPVAKGEPDYWLWADA